MREIARATRVSSSDIDATSNGRRVAMLESALRDDPSQSGEQRAYTENELCRMLDQVSAIRLALFDHKTGEALEGLQKLQGEMRGRLTRLRSRVFDQDNQFGYEECTVSNGMNALSKAGLDRR